MKFAWWRFLVLCLSIFALEPKAMGQLPLTFGNLTIENGLSQNSVISVVQDTAGFLWFGTRQGLNRYDGYQLKVYRNSLSNPSSISGNEIQALFSDAAGQLWVGTSDGLNRYDQEKDAFVNIRIKNGLSSNNIESIYEDADHNLWVGTIAGLNLLTDKKRNGFSTFLFSSIKTDPINRISSIFRDKNKNLWLGTGRGLVCMSPGKGGYTYKAFRHKATHPNSLNSNYVTAIAADRQQNLWIGTDNGLALFNPKNGVFHTFRHNNADSNSLIHNDIREIKLDHKGLLWIGTQEGLSILDPATLKFSNYQHEPEVKGSISHNSIHSIFQDAAKNMWVGTYFGGVNFAYPIATRFKVYQNSKLKPSISGNVISSIVEDKEGSLWIATEGAGLNYADLKHNFYKSYKTNPDNPSSISSNLIKIMCLDRSGNGDLIIGTHYGGLNIFNPSKGDFRHIVNVRNDKNMPGTAEIIALLHDSRGTLWVGSMNGLSVLRKKNGAFTWRTSKSPLDKYVHKGRYGVTALFEDHEKNLWMGTTAGLYRYNFKTKLLQPFLKSESETDSTRLHSDFINCIGQNKAGKILIGTYFGGLSIYDPATNRFKTFREKDGLANDNVLGIIEDDNRKLWISTGNGLSELNPDSKKFRNYTKSDGLAGNEFNARSYFKNSQGELFFGGLNGLSSFYPSDIQTNTYAAPVVFTGLKLFNQPVSVNGPDQLLKEHMMLTRMLTFKHDQNHFTIGFALLNYIKSDKNKYAYKLEGYDKEWNYTGIPSATYTNLPSGSYRFRVKGINNDGFLGAGEANTAIRILPPVWASWWAYLIYVLIFSIIFFLIVRYLFIRALLKRSEDVQKMKLNFFTYVSHEIRTPLTLILGPLEALSKSTKDNPEINRQVLPIRNNAERLMRLITELMDFRKAETGHLRLNISKDNIIGFIEEIFQSFQHLATLHQIKYRFDHEQKNIDLYFDKSQLEKVLFNLLSNAFKFTHDEGSISVSVNETAEHVIVKVRDNGKGIPYESQNKLFSDFFQVDELGSSHIGSGIGLALSKSIVEAHGGTIGIESSPATAEQPGNTCFTVTLKKGKTHFKAAEFTAPVEQAASPKMYTHQLQAETKQGPVKKTNAETILLVEDNPEIRQMLRGFLDQDYEIKESADGLQGWETAAELLPDLIICDVMMPVMDGLELCAKLKTDERTSHIPVILLTAKSTHLHQLEGMETGADSYVTKPFSVELLQLNVRNLLQSRKTMRQKFSQQVTLQPQNITVNTAEHTFMSKMLQYIEEHMADQDFNIPELSAHIGMSQPVLYKKIRAITDLSVNDFIKTIRLKKAMQLLEQRAYNISEIAYLVGFNDPKYFSREFRKHYGQTPKEYLNTHGNS